MPLHISDEWLETIKSRQPEFKSEKMERYAKEFGIPEYDIEMITDSKRLADLFEETAALCNQPKKVANWIIGEIMRIQERLTVMLQKMYLLKYLRKILTLNSMLKKMDLGR